MTVHTTDDKRESCERKCDSYLSSQLRGWRTLWDFICSNKITAGAVR